MTYGGISYVNMTQTSITYGVDHIIKPKVFEGDISCVGYAYCFIIEFQNSIIKHLILSEK